MADTYLFDVNSGSFTTAANWDDLSTGANPSPTAPGVSDTAELVSNGGTIVGPGTAATLIGIGADTVSLAGTFVALDNFIDGGATLGGPTTMTLLSGGTILADGGTAATSPDFIVANFTSLGSARLTLYGTLDTTGHAAVIGATGAGTVVVEPGGRLTAGSDNNAAFISVGGSTLLGAGFIGEFAGSTGTLDILGGGATGAFAGTLDVGAFGSGAVSVANGGTLTTQGLAIGAATGASGIVTVTGSGSTLANSGTMAVDGVGTGTLDVLSGGLLTTSPGATDAGTALVSGQQATWAIGGTLAVGPATSANLVVANTGTVTALALDAGGSAGSLGAVTVTGAGSLLQVGSLALGGAAGGVGSLAVTNGGRVITGALTGLNDATLTVDPTSYLEIGNAGTGAAGAITVDPGAILAGASALDSPIVNNGTVLVANGLESLGSISGGGVVLLDSNGTLALTGPISAATPITNQAGSNEVVLLATALPATGTIDFTNPVTATQYTPNGSDGGSLLVTTSVGTVTVDLTGGYSGQPFYITPDGAGGSDISLAPFYLANLPSGLGAAVSGLVSRVAAGDAVSHVSTDDGVAFQAAIGGAINVAEFAGGSATLPAGTQIGVLAAGATGLTDTATTGGNLLIGNAGGDVLATEGADTLVAGSGSTTLSAAGGGFVLVGGGTNTITLAGANATTHRRQQHHLCRRQRVAGRRRCRPGVFRRGRHHRRRRRACLGVFGHGRDHLWRHRGDDVRLRRQRQPHGGQRQRQHAALRIGGEGSVLWRCGHHAGRRHRRGHLRWWRRAFAGLCRQCRQPVHRRQRRRAPMCWVRSAATRWLPASVRARCLPAAAATRCSSAARRRASRSPARATRR